MKSKQSLKDWGKELAELLTDYYLLCMTYPTPMERKRSYKPFKDLIQSTIDQTKSQIVEQILGMEEDRLEKLIDKDTAKLLGDSFEIFNEERCCKICGFHPERQRALIFDTIKHLRLEIKEELKKP